VKRKILSVLKGRFQQEFIDRLAEQGHFDGAVEQILKGADNPYRVGDELYRQFTK
jgi:hypothetical protein